MAAPAFNLLQSQKQKLKISPTQIRLLNFLQLNLMELEQYIKNELEENPLLEEHYTEEQDENVKDVEFASTPPTPDPTQDYMDWDEFNNDDLPDYRTHINDVSSDSDSIYAAVIAEASDWRSDLKQQFHLLPFSERQLQFSDFIIDSLTDQGYLCSSVSVLTNDISLIMGQFVEEDEIRFVVDCLRQTAPIGLGAKDLKDCLLMQLAPKKGNTAGVASWLVDDLFEEVVTRNYDKIMRMSGLTQRELKEAMVLISTLQPYPIRNGGATTSSPLKETIVPEYIITVENEAIEVALNSRRLPVLKINKKYTQRVGSSRLVSQYVSSKIASAKWLIEAIVRRQTTMLKTMRAIVNLQQTYFQSGDISHLRPMILRDIAERIKMDVSTISRTISGKYAQTPFGIIHLKDLFTEGVKTKTGEEVSNRQIQSTLVEIVSQEDKHQPFNDTQLTDILAHKGYPLARRTVAKYRDLLGIPSATMRRVL